MKYYSSIGQMFCNCFTLSAFLTLCVFGKSSMVKRDHFDALDQSSKIHRSEQEFNTVDFGNEESNNVIFDQDQENLVCPRKTVLRSFFSLPCLSTKDCSFFGKDLLCCNNRCEKGIFAPKSKRTIIEDFQTQFNLQRREECPLETLVEIFPVKECRTDDECFPARVCCPDSSISLDFEGGHCRMPYPDFDKMPQYMQPFKSVISYLQCTPPPPPFLDFFPKPCRTQFDCFPNLCCMENGKKHCRPPKKSVLSLIANVGQRFVQSGVVKRFISNIIT